MPEVARLIGGAGTGKTTELLRIMDAVLEHVHDPHLIGFCSFTRAARREASSRAADRYGIKPSELEQNGWFRTLHSVAYRCLGVGKELLTDCADDRKWLQDVLQEDVAGTMAAGDTPYSEPFSDEARDPDRALSIWGCARNRLTSLETVWAEVDETSDKTPDFEYVKSIAGRYETGKRIYGRVDFTDILARFAGWRFEVRGAERTTPDGEPPQLPVWFFDEQQDASGLLDSVCKRLADQSSVNWVYVAGDYFQSIFGWSGANPRYFMDWPANKERTMPCSYRCAPEILAVGEEILSECSDYWDRKIKPAEHDGTVDTANWGSDLTSQIDPSQSWLLLARTNFQARRIAKLLDDAEIPWIPTRGGGSAWAAPVRNMAIKALANLEHGAPCDGSEWQAILKKIPSQAGGDRLLEMGTKSRFASMEETAAQDQYPWVMIDEITTIGGTARCVEAIKAGKWREWVEDAEEYLNAVRQWGQEVVDNPKVRVGTIHSAKGSEADNVAVLSTISAPIYRGAQTDDGFNAENRCWYVAATRAKTRLLIVNENHPRYRKAIPV